MAGVRPSCATWPPLARRLPRPAKAAAKDGDNGDDNDDDETAGAR